MNKRFLNEMRTIAIKSSVLLMLVSLLAPSLVQAGSPVIKKDFPRLGGYQISSTPYPGHYANPEYQAELAKLDIAILGGVYGMNEAAEAVKAINPKIVLAKYVNVWNTYHVFNDKYYQDMIRLVDAGKGPNNTNASDWWARDDQGQKTSRWRNNWSINLTEFVQPNANGQRWPEVNAQHNYNYWFNNDVWDFWYSDDVYWRVRRSYQGTYPDWSGRGTGSLTPAEVDAAFRKGHENSWTAMRALTPDKMIMANTADWPTHEDKLGRRDIPEYDQKIEGGLMEHMMSGGKDENWRTIMTNYRRGMSYLKDPKVLIFLVHGDPTDYKFFRYAFATCLMDGGFFDFAPPKHLYGTVEWYDEFDLAGTSDTSWLGQAISAPPTQAWQNGVWRRDFNNGVALVNPAGNGRQTVSLEGGLKTINGTQDPAVNDGRSVQQITLSAGDGIILVRDSVVDTPAPPQAPVLRIRQ